MTNSHLKTLFLMKTSDAIFLRRIGLFSMGCTRINFMLLLTNPNNHSRIVLSIVTYFKFIYTYYLGIKNLLKWDFFTTTVLNIEKESILNDINDMRSPRALNVNIKYIAAISLYLKCKIREVFLNCTLYRAIKPARILQS